MNNEYTEDFIFAAATCLQWQASDMSEDGGNGYPITEEGDEYTEAVADVIREDCLAFLESAEDLLTADGIPASQAGHDFILSANHHGTGFWDRGYPHGDELHDLSDGYQVGAEFALDDRYGDVEFLMVDNTIIVKNGELQ